MEPEALARLHALCFDDAPNPWSEAGFRTLLADPHVILVTSSSGFALARTASGEAELLTLAVHPDARRRGHGRKLLQSLEIRLAKTGATKIFCEVSEANATARKLYDTFGFVSAGRRKDYYRTSHGRYIDAIVLKKPIG